jgi:hypothetical protein
MKKVAIATIAAASAGGAAASRDHRSEGVQRADTSRCLTALAAYFDIEKVVVLCVLELVALGALQRYDVRFPQGTGEQPSVVDLPGLCSEPAVAEPSGSEGCAL